MRYKRNSAVRNPRTLRGLRPRAAVAGPGTTRDDSGAAPARQVVEAAEAPLLGWRRAARKERDEWWLRRHSGAWCLVEPHSPNPIHRHNDADACRRQDPPSAALVVATARGDCAVDGCAGCRERSVGWLGGVSLPPARPLEVSKSHELNRSQGRPQPPSAALSRPRRRQRAGVA
jgi:hypothetical protein